MDISYKEQYTGYNTIENNTEYIALFNITQNTYIELMAQPIQVS